MASVEAQLEANGLPTQFESASNEPNVSHAITNSAATISNSEVSEMKTNAPDLDVTTTTSSSMQPVQPAEASHPTTVEDAPLPSNDVSLPSSNTIPQPMPSTIETSLQSKVNGHHQDSNGEIGTQATDAASETNPPESITTTQEHSSITVPEILDSTSIAPTASSNEAIPQIPSDQPQPQVSDLRTAPHSDRLSPQAVASIEAEKHEIDDRADKMSEDIPPVTTESLTSKSVEEASPSIQDASSANVPPEPITTAVANDVTNGTVVPSVEAVNPSIPGEAPADPAPTPVASSIESHSAPTQMEDQEMTEAPSLSMKAVHHREEDQDVEERAAKRMKTEDRSPMDQGSFKIPESPQPTSSAAPTSDQIPVDDSVTSLRLVHMKKVISNLKKSNASAAFRLPVDPVALKIPTYFDTVKKPMDLHTIDDRLKKNEYKSIQAFRDDFNQIVKNCIAFNGPDHSITQQGRKMESSFNNQMSHLPPVTIDEPAKTEKKVVKPPTKIETVRAPAPRRSSVTAKAASPKTTPSPATFAPDPSGMPLIRRDSAMDGRPKRAIVPPKRNSDFGGARPKKKKYELELKFCDEVLKNISSTKHWTINQYFTHPVDPVSLNIPTYFQIVKKPMDLGTVRQKLDGSMYERAKDFEEDVRLIFKNCYKFNPEGDYVYQRGQELEKLFNTEWSKKQEWISAREPESEPTSVAGDYDEEAVSEEEEEPESEEDDRSAKIVQLQQQIEMMQKQVGQLTSKKPKTKSPGAPSKKSEKKKVKKEAPKTQFPGLKPNKPKKSASKPKVEKDRYVTFAEKQYISNGIALLPERQMSEALKIIQNSVPALANSDQNEIELDIEEVPNHALLKLLNFVKKYAGPPPEEPREETYPTQGAVTKKKNRMSRQEQDDQIASLRGTLHNYQEGGSPDAIQSIETGGDDSEDDESNEESEEE